MEEDELVLSLRFLKQNREAVMELLEDVDCGMYTYQQTQDIIAVELDCDVDMYIELVEILMELDLHLE